MHEIPDERTHYTHAELVEEDLGDDPIAALAQWLRDAEAADVPEPTAMCVATADAEGRSDARMVLLRGLDEQGLVFFSHLSGPKGDQLKAKAWATAVFWWAPLERQVRVRGPVSLASDEISDRYWQSRPRESQLASAASAQSQPVDSREALEEAVRRLDVQYPAAVPRPSRWRGVQIAVQEMEFWQGRPARLHDRLLFCREGAGWIKTRLAP